MKKSKYIWYNGKFVPWEKATTHVLSHGLHYGTGGLPRRHGWWLQRICFVQGWRDPVHQEPGHRLRRAEHPSQLHLPRLRDDQPHPGADRGPGNPRATRRATPYGTPGASRGDSLRRPVPRLRRVILRHWCSPGRRRRLHGAVGWDR